MAFLLDPFNDPLRLLYVIRLGQQLDFQEVRDNSAVLIEVYAPCNAL